MIGNHSSFSLSKQVIALCLFYPALAFSEPYIGVNYSHIVLSHTPEPLQGSQVMFNFSPKQFHWRQWSVYFDGGFSYFRASHTTVNKIINIYSGSPVVRFISKHRGLIRPYVEGGIGIAYLNRSRIQKRNLGIHFSFQDRVGLGALLGKQEKLSIGLHAVHYSNAHFSSHNSGITIPLLLDIGYRF